MKKNYLWCLYDKRSKEVVTRSDGIPYLLESRQCARNYKPVFLDKNIVVRKCKEVVMGERFQGRKLCSVQG